MANLRVRPYVHSYLEDPQGKNLSEARQADRWLREVPHEVLTPMLHVRNKDFYIFEPTMLDDGTVCMPMRWFSRVESETRTWCTKAWRMNPVVTETHAAGWCVIQNDDFEILADHLLKTFPELERDAARYNLPQPSRIVGA